MTEPVLQADRLRKQFGQTVAVEELSFAMKPGSSLGIVGESGAGKTTVARMILGLETPSSGTVTACGRDRSSPARSATERRERGREVQIVFQDPYSSLDPRERVGQGLERLLKLHGIGEASQRRDRAVALARQVGLGDRQLQALPRALSGGQRQRVAIARALAPQPRIVVLDEAVASLDVSIQAQVLNLLAEIRETTGVSYLFISHDLAVVRHLTDDVIVMHRGQVVERGPTPRILDEPEHEYTQRLRASIPGPGWSPHRRAREEPSDGYQHPRA
ncbi:MAG TPA: ATP-binding cassette domain-containing protein [Solirubrobacteraceae bacterium]|nr:ATP-binding cassette domain-containing protein [Solirubrobacteraceae bacterium]